MCNILYSNIFFIKTLGNFFNEKLFITTSELIDFNNPLSLKSVYKQNIGKFLIDVKGSIKPLRKPIIHLLKEAR